MASRLPPLRLEVGKDGKTAYERAKGKKATVVGIEFGEKFCGGRRKETRWPSSGASGDMGYSWE